MSEESKLLAEDKSVVVPGEVLATGMEFLPSTGTYRREDKIYANQTGLLTIEGKVLKTLPVASVYLPKRNDVIIGRVIDILMTGWRLHTNGPYSAVLPLKDATFDYIRKDANLTEWFDLDEHVMCKVVQVTTQNLVDVSMKGPGLRKLAGGRVIKVNAAKVPRVIGKRGSMVSMVKQATACQIAVGQNGVIWLKGEPEQERIAIDVIKKIEAEAHVPGLTERIKTFLEETTGKRIDMDAIEREAEQYEMQRSSYDGPRREGGERRDGPDRSERYGRYGGHGGDRGGRGYGGDRRGGDRRDDRGGRGYGGDRRGGERREGGEQGGGERRFDGPREGGNGERRDGPRDGEQHAQQERPREYRERFERRDGGSDGPQVEKSTTDEPITQ